MCVCARAYRWPQGERKSTAHGARRDGTPAGAKAPTPAAAPAMARAANLALRRPARGVIRKRDQGARIGTGRMLSHAGGGGARAGVRGRGATRGAPAVPVHHVFVCSMWPQFRLARPLISARTAFVVTARRLRKMGDQEAQEERAEHGGGEDGMQAASRPPEPASGETSCMGPFRRLFGLGRKSSAEQRGLREANVRLWFSVLQRVALDRGEAHEDVRGARKDVQEGDLDDKSRKRLFELARFDEFFSEELTAMERMLHQESPGSRKVLKVINGILQIPVATSEIPAGRGDRIKKYQFAGDSDTFKRIQKKVGAGGAACGAAGRVRWQRATEGCVRTSEPARGSKGGRRMGCEGRAGR